MSPLDRNGGGDGMRNTGIGFPHGSVRKVVQDNVNGFVCADTDEMVRRVSDIDTIDRRTVRRISETRFSSEKISQDYLALYEKLRAGEINDNRKINYARFAFQFTRGSL